MVHNETDILVKIIEENYFNNIDFDFGDEVMKREENFFQSQ